MPNIKPVSDLRNYAEVLKEINYNNPIFLTKNGRGRYVIIDIKEYEKLKSTIELLNNLKEGEKSAEQNGWVNEDEVLKHMGLNE